VSQGQFRVREKASWKVGPLQQCSAITNSADWLYRAFETEDAWITCAVWLHVLAPAADACWENKVLPVVAWWYWVGYMTCTFEILTKWFSLTRLETRTKESNIYASIWVANPDA
jgi:hypothetical protein